MRKTHIELVRESTESQPEQSQRETNRFIRESNNLYQDPEDTHREEVLLGVSGTRSANTDVMQRIVARAKRGELAGIIFCEFSRLMRTKNLNDLAVIQSFVDAGLKIYTSEEVLDLKDPRDLRRIVTATLEAGDELDRIRERTMRGKEALRRIGYNASGPKSFPRGTRFVWTSRVPKNRQGFWETTEEIETVKLLFKFVLSGITSRADLSRRTGIPIYLIVDTIANPIYTGWIVTQYEHSGKECKRRDRDRSKYHSKLKQLRQEGSKRPPLRVQAPGKGSVYSWKDSRFESFVPFAAPIKESDWKQANELIKRPSALHSRTRVQRAKFRFLLADFVSCAVCGQRHYVHHKVKTDGTYTGYYACKRADGHAPGRYPQSPLGVLPLEERCQTGRIPSPDLDEHMTKICATKLWDRDFLADCLKQLDRMNDARRDPARAKEIHARLDKLATARASLMELVKSGDLSPVEFRASVSDIERERDTLTRTLLEVEVQTIEIDPKKLRERVLPFKRFREMSFDAKRQILRRTIASLHVAKAKDARGFSEEMVRGLSFHPAFVSPFEESGDLDVVAYAARDSERGSINTVHPWMDSVVAPFSKSCIYIPLIN
jgi:ribosomal protein L32